MANRWGNNGNSERLYFLGLQLTKDGDCSHEIKRCLLLGRKVMTILSSVAVSHSLQPYELQHTRLPCPSPTLGAYSNPCPLSWWCHPIISSCLPLLLLPSIFPSIRAFSSESVLLIRWPNTGIPASASVLPMNILGLISFRIDRFDLLAVQGTLKSLLQNQLKASIFRSLAFFMVQFSYLRFCSRII